MSKVFFIFFTAVSFMLLNHEKMRAMEKVTDNPKAAVIKGVLLKGKKAKGKKSGKSVMFQEESASKVECKEEYARIQYEEGENHFLNNRYVLARQCFENAVHANNFLAAYRLGTMCELALGGYKDEIRAMALYETAAQFGSTEAMIKLGEYCYSHQDYVNARKFFEKAAKIGTEADHCLLRTIYAKDLGKDDSESDAKHLMNFEKK